MPGDRMSACCRLGNRDRSARQTIVNDNASLIRASGGAYRRCFACGTENPIGLHLQFRREDGGARAEFQPRPEHQGWDGILHGGIVMTLLDETLAYAAMFAVGPAVTAEIHARLRKPAPIEQIYTLFGKVQQVRLGLVNVRATIVDVAGQLIAEADGKFMAIRESTSIRSNDVI